MLKIASKVHIDQVSTRYCRRRQTRRKLSPAQVTCWSANAAPRTVTVIEADSCGARLVLPFRAMVGEIVRVSFADNLGLHQTRPARVAWTHRFDAANRVMVGLAFEEEMLAA
jgi:hypothetical protein